MALRDVSLEMLGFRDAGESPPPETIGEWHAWIHSVQVAHNALAHACEEIVENGATSQRLKTMELKLAHAMGQATYRARKDRW